MLAHHPGRVAQFALLAPPAVFKLIYQMLAPLCPPAVLARVKMLRGGAVDAYCDAHLTPKRTRRAAPSNRRDWTRDPLPRECPANAC
eukprot:614977-Prymnesium_polylepis.1